MALNISQGFQRIWMFCITLRLVPPTCYVFKIGRCYIASIGFHFEKDFTLHSKLGCFVSSKIGNITLPSQVGHFVSSETRSTLSYFCLVHSHCKFLIISILQAPHCPPVKVIFQHKHQSSSSKVHKFDASI